jgi:hypothetical protein
MTCICKYPGKSFGTKPPPSRHNPRCPWHGDPQCRASVEPSGRIMVVQCRGCLYWIDDPRVLGNRCGLGHRSQGADWGCASGVRKHG